MTIARNNFFRCFGVQPLGCLLLLASGFWLLASSPVHAQYRPDHIPDAGPAIVTNPGIVEKSGAQLPLDLSFTASDGTTTPLAAHFNHGRPVILSLVYFDCPNICGFNQDSLVASV